MRLFAFLFIKAVLLEGIIVDTIENMRRTMRGWYKREMKDAKILKIEESRLNRPWAGFFVAMTRHIAHGR